MELIIIIILLSLSLIIETIKIMPKKETNVIKSNIDTELIKYVLDEDNILDKINNLIDTMIKDAIELYSIFNTFNEETYINNEMAEELSNYCLGMVKNKLTDTMKNTIGIVYDISTEKKLDDVIKLRIKLHIINYMVEQNQPIE